MTTRCDGWCTLVADVHQPLHVSLAEDRGGNDIRVTIPTPDGPTETNLHRVWDVTLVERAGLDVDAYVAELLDDLTDDENERVPGGIIAGLDRRVVAPRP